MNKIQCLTDKSDYEIYPDFLNFRIDDYWLDEKLEELYPKSNYRGLVPTLDFYLQREKEKQVVWQRILPDEKQTTICPILMCPDDNDFSCTLIVAEIKNCGNTIQWKRLGLDQTQEWNAEKAGTKVLWLDKFPELNFDKAEYLQTIETFKRQIEKMTMTKNEKFIYESIIAQVRMGFLPTEWIKENIIEEIEDNGFDNEISKEWAFEHIDKERARLIAESKQWKSPTDTARLIKAFNELCDTNIIALHNAGYTTSDGNYEAVEVERELRKSKIISDGYCFYHKQDLSRAIADENPSLYIAFQKVDNSDDEITIGVGKKVVDILKKNDFEVEWDGTANSKILIPHFKWQLIYNENNRDLSDYKEVVKRMTK